MNQKVYRVQQLASRNGVAGMLPVSTATLWRWVKEGKFPKPFKLGARVTVWDAAEVDAFIVAQRSATQTGSANV